ncbi:MAG: C cytochrome precursor [Planctomycetaceae bacterium]|nr:C cytochrome precursor [Planctomycetaceae bacterium]
MFQLLLLLTVYALVILGVFWRKPAWGFWGVSISFPVLLVLMMGLWPVIFPPQDWTPRENQNGRPEDSIAAAPRRQATRPDSGQPNAQANETPQITQASFEPYRPIERASDGYVQGEACRECHPGNYESWHDSYHRTMTQLADPAIVMGNFDGQTVETSDASYRLLEEDGICWAELPTRILSGNRGPNAGISRVPLVMTTGSHHMQVYWFPLAAGRTLGQFPLVYLKEAERWVPRHSCFLQPPGDPPGIEAGRWNNTCLQCHTTHPKQKLSRDFSFDTDVAEFGISCEACHGPGQAHINYRRQDDGQLRRAEDPIVNPEHLTHEKSSQTCGNCHSITTHLQAETRNEGHAFRPGKELEASRHLFRINERSKAELQRRGQNPEEFFDASFWPDGMVRVSGREFNGLIESPCYQQGEMSCLSCHALHQQTDDQRDTKLWADDQLAMDMRSDQACLQCHNTTDYGPQHTHHATASSGSRCYNCHMPHTTYGLLKAIRSHTVSSPSVQRDDLQAGRPNACNLCHLDQTLQWTADHLAEWWKIEKPALLPAQQEVAAGAIWTLTGDASIRALVAWHLGWQAAQEVSDADWMSRYLIELLNDPYDAVRYIASRSLKSIPEFASQDYDHLADESQRKMRQAELIKRWNAGSAAGQRGTQPRLLIEAGRISQGTWNSLRKLRDETPIFLDE